MLRTVKLGAMAAVLAMVAVATTAGVALAATTPVSISDRWSPASTEASATTGSRATAAVT